MNKTRNCLFFVLLVALAPACAFLKYPRNGIYLIPKGFTGPVVILFNQPDGVELRSEGGLYVYEIPVSGLLRVKGRGYTGIVNLSYFYVDSEGNRIPLRYLHITGDRDPQGRPKDKFDGQINASEYENGIFVTNAGGVGTTKSAKGDFSSSGFIVGHPKDVDRHYGIKQDRLFDLQREAISKGLH